MIRRVQLGEADRQIARDLQVSRKTVRKYRAWAEQHDIVGGPLPDPAALEAQLKATLSVSAPPPVPSKGTPFREQVITLRQRGVECRAHLRHSARAARLHRQLRVGLSVRAPPRATDPGRMRARGNGAGGRSAGGFRRRRPATGSRDRHAAQGVGVRDDTLVQPTQLCRVRVRPRGRHVAPLSSARVRVVRRCRAADGARQSDGGDRRWTD